MDQALFSLEGEMATPPVFLLENSVDRGNWWGAVHGVAKSQTGLSIKTIEYSSLCYSVGPYLSILYIIVCICLKAL